MNNDLQQPSKHYYFPFNIYTVQRRPSFAHIFVNKGTEGIGIIDVYTGVLIEEKPFSKNFDSSGIINAWCLKSDGNSMMAFNHDSYTACIITFNDKQMSVDIKPPPFKTFWDLRYLWDDQSCLLTGGRLSGIYMLNLKGDVPLFLELTGREAASVNLPWLKMINQIPIDDCNVLKVETDKKQFVYHNYSVTPALVSVANWDNGMSWSIKAPSKIFELAVQHQTLFFLYEHKIDIVNSAGKVTGALTPPQGFHFISMDTLPASEKNNESLIAVSNSLSGPLQSCVAVYKL